MRIIEIKESKDKQEIAKKVLRDLPEWFGIEESTKEYIENVVKYTFIAAYIDNEVVGFYSLRHENKDTLDMYVLGATGKNRFQVQMLNLHDPCCFQGTYFKHYESFIKEKVNDFGNGSFEVISDIENIEHRISEFSIDKIYEKL